MAVAVAGRSPLGPILVRIADTRVADAPVSLAVLTCRAGVSAVWNRQPLGGELQCAKRIPPKQHLQCCDVVSIGILAQIR